MSRRPFSREEEAVAFHAPCGNCGRTDHPMGVNADGVCGGCAIARATSRREARAQVADALAGLDRPASDYLAWPWPAVDRITGPMAPGQVYVFCAFSGNGKTTFSQSAVRAWWQQGVSGYVLPLEARAKEWRVGLACLELGVNPALALSGKLRLAEAAGDLDAARTRQAIRAELERWTTRDALAACDRLYVSGREAINLRGLEEACAHAKQLGARYVLVDHVDHVEPEDYTAMVAESQRVNKAALRLAKHHDLIVILASQLNMEIVKGDGLSKYHPPQVNQLMFPAVKTHVAATIIGLHRVIDAQADAELIAKAKRREIAPTEVLLPGVMGVANMKQRHQDADAHEGARTQLAVHHGRVESLDAEERRANEAAAHGIWSAGPSERTRGAA